MSNDHMPCEHGYYGLCPQCVRDERDRLRARVAELERQLATGDYDYTVDEICNAYESGVGHRGRPTAKVNPYRPGSELAIAYDIGAVGEREQQIGNSQSDEIDRLRAALAEAQRDAERYRFLQRRVCVVGTEALCGVRMKAAKFVFVNLPKLSEVPGNAACALDAAIDAAILATKEGKKDE